MHQPAALHGSGSRRPHLRCAGHRRGGERGRDADDLQLDRQRRPAAAPRPENGGGLLTVDYAKAGLLPAQRQVQAPWRDYAQMPDVALVPLDPQVTTVDLAEVDPIQVARGSPVTDKDGTRQATLLFPQGAQAT